MKFFRKLRLDNLEKNKTGKYFKYALGEVLLVVIGILIALSVNNWNQERIKRNQEMVLVNSIIEELNLASAHLERNLTINKMSIDRMSQFLDIQNIDSVESFVNPLFLLSHDPARVNVPNIDNLLSSSENSPLSSQSSFQKLRALKSHYNRIDAHEGYMDEFWNNQSSNLLIRKGHALKAVNDFRKNKNMFGDFRALYEDNEFKNLIALKWMLQDQWIHVQQVSLDETKSTLEYFTQTYQ